MVREVGSWLMVYEEFKGLSLSGFVRDWVTSISFSAPLFAKNSMEWIPPPPESIKLNFDGASKGNPGPARYGCVVRNCHGGVVWASASP